MLGMLLSLAALLAISSFPPRSLALQARTQQDAENQVNSGLYRIRYCGTGPGSHAEQMLALLPKVWSNIQPLRGDIMLGTHSPAFWAFFKSRANVQTVSRIFSIIAFGKPITIPARLGVPSAQVVTPSFLCVENLPGDSKGLQQHCAKNPSARMAVLRDTELVLICPSFWELPDDPSTDFCPRVRRNRFTPNDDSLITSKFGAIIHQITHIYIKHDAKLSPTRDWNEVPRVMDAVELSASKSLGNAVNYAMYASGESRCISISRKGERWTDLLVSKARRLPTVPEHGPSTQPRRIPSSLAER